MNVVVGVDVTSVERIAALLERRPRFATKIFTEAERRRIGGKAERFATRWAAKEAVKKLYGSRGLMIPTYRSIEVVNRRGGAPIVRVDGADTDIAISLTHDVGLAIAVAAAPDPGLGAPPVLMPADSLRLPERPADAHKGTFGTVVVVAGARGTAGAALLSALGAARGGAGLVRACVPEAVYDIVAAQALEVMVHPLPADGGGLSAAAPAALRDGGHLQAADALVIGPGLGRSAATEAAVLGLLAAVEAPLVVDADGLNIAAARGFDWGRRAGPTVLTPHPAELGRLLGTDVPAVQRDREAAARDYAERHGVVVVLKGARTVVAAPGRMHVDGHSTAALATGGTGDVLAGLCGAMLAAGLDPFDAAVAAVTIHAEAGCIVEAQKGRAGGLAGDLAAALPLAQERLRRMQERITEYRRSQR
jgi:hydroxyethylthiazole kinase-like uncharacterized protein yjeF